MKNSQKQQVYLHLKMHGTITSWEAIQKYRITRLASIIHTLRQEGFDITTEDKYTPEGKNYGLYTLQQKGQMSFV